MVKVKLVSIPEVQPREIILEEKCFSISDVLIALSEKSGHDFYNHKENYMIMKNSELLKSEGNGDFTVDDTDTIIIMNRICGG